MTTDIDNGSSTYPVLSPSGDGSDVTAAFTAASTRTNISTGEKLGVIFGKIAKWFTDLGDAAFRGVDSTVTASSTNLVESGAVKSALNTVDESIAIRVSGNKTTYASGAAIGQYVIVDESTITGIADGLYKAAKAIPYNTVIDSTYLTAVSGGAANDLKSAIDTMSTVSTVTLPTPTLTGCYWASGASMVRFGRLIICNIGIVIPSGSYANNQVILSGFPASITDFPLIATSRDGNAVQLNITTNGKLRFDANQTVSKLQVFLASFAYIATSY